MGKRQSARILRINVFLFKAQLRSTLADMSANDASVGEHRKSKLPLTNTMAAKLTQGSP